MGKTVTLDQVKAAFTKDMEKMHAMIAKRIKKARSADEIMEGLDFYIEDVLTDKTTNLAIKYNDQQEGN